MTMADDPPEPAARTTFPRETVRLAFAAGSPISDEVVPAVMTAAGLAPDPPVERHVRATFWDTGDGRLAAAGGLMETSGRATRLGLQVGPLRRRVWTVGGLGRPPTMQAFAAARQFPDELRAAALAPTLSSDGRARTWSAGRGGVAVSLETTDWSRGEARVAEELLTIEAAPRAGAAAVDLAVALAPALALRLLPAPAEARAAARIAGMRAPPLRVPIPALDASASAIDGLRAIGQASLHQMLGNLAAVTETDTADGVHQFRVALRRLRSALRLFRKLLAKPERKALGDGLRWLSQLFADAREWDVLIDETLKPLAAEVDDGALAPLLLAAEGRRTLAYASLRTALAGPEPTRVLLQVARWFEIGAVPVRDGRGPPALGGFARRALRQARKRLRERHETAAAASVEEWHELRILAKQARYATDAFRSLYPRRAVRPYLDALVALQDCLGGINDAAVARRMVADLAGDAPDPGMATAAALVSGWTARERSGCHRAVARLWDEFDGIEPFWR
ncbi:MAG: CHAD domain-containing protein [Alphaproteobacteria bacterium]